MRVGDLLQAGVYLVGPGRLGLSLGYALRAAGVPLAGVAYHSAAGRERAAQAFPDALVEPVTAPVASGSAAAIVVTVVDEAIPQAAAALAPHRIADQVVVHTSGLFTGDLLRAGGLAAPVGSFHPLQTFADPTRGSELLAACVIALEGDAEAVAAGQTIARILGAEAVTLASDAKVAYHAAAVVASNYLVALTSLATQLAACAGLDEATAIKMLAPLQRGTLSNLGELGVGRALTGPIARGDAATVRAHLALIDAQAPELRAAYTLLGRHALDLARTGELDEAKAAELEELLEPL